MSHLVHPSDDKPELYDEKQVCDLIGCSKYQLSKLVESGQFPAPVVSARKLVRYNVAAVHRALGVSK
ncbi:hypothetical protein NG895_04160 [Aeoliella sp. ICT_H6.2]|uniref:AlpA family transcriptional regulator n=1 Tax=Aeoliella straminimaris TaxID=2954799 RepID=A0A9X2JEJ8_9BACT|nr:hypothetical protein [Aeoliella straminimaris]MCO6043090.1 hypothetical protein [Aeoliella straminimaris]